MTDRWAHARWCDGCQRHHGWLYTCDSYSAELKAEIAVREEKYLRNLADPVWCQRQVDNGVPPVVISIFRAMNGIEP